MIGEGANFVRRSRACCVIFTYKNRSMNTASVDFKYATLINTGCGDNILRIKEDDIDGQRMISLYCNRTIFKNYLLKYTMFNMVN